MEADRAREAAVLGDGYHDVPDDRVAAVVTWLRMAEPEPARGPRGPAPRLDPVGADLPRYRALFAAVGEPWLWFSRRRMDDGRLGAILSHPDVLALALIHDGRDAGLLELDWREEGRCELAFFGLAPDAVGLGLGRALMNEAVRLAWARPIRELVVHTCTLDHPAALPFYIRSGFVPYRRLVEIAPDPRLTGDLPLGAAAAHCPVLGRA